MEIILASYLTSAVLVFVFFCFLANLNGNSRSYWYLPLVVFFWPVGFVAFCGFFFVPKSWMKL